MSDAPGITWQVISQQETSQIGPTGQFVSGVKVMFRTGSGAEGSVFVPWTSYSPGQVKDLIAARAADVEAVAGLTQAS